MLGAPRRNAKLQLGKVICEEGVCDSRGQFISVLVDSLLEITLRPAALASGAIEVIDPATAGKVATGFGRSE